MKGINWAWKRKLWVMLAGICAAIGVCSLFSPLLHRGKLRITIENQSAQELVLTGINEQDFCIVIAPGESCKVSYKITYAAGIEMKLEHDGAVISTELVGYVEPAYSGTIQAKITEVLENEFEIEVKSRVDF